MLGLFLSPSVRRDTRRDSTGRPVPAFSVQGGVASMLPPQTEVRSPRTGACGAHAGQSRGGPRSLEPSLQDWLSICPRGRRCSGCSQHPPRGPATELSLHLGPSRAGLFLFPFEICAVRVLLEEPHSQGQRGLPGPKATSCRPPQLPAMQAHRVCSPLSNATCKQIWSVRGMPSVHKTLHTR